jgi:hypothetical protein
MVNFLRRAQLKIRVRNKDATAYIKEYQIDNLRMSFAITKSISWATNTGILKCWNLSNGIRNDLKDFGDEVELHAGYEDDAGLQLCYWGQTTAVFHSYDFPEIVSTFECGDGDKYYNNTFANLSYAAQMPVQQVILDIAKRMGVNVQLPLPLAPNIVYETGFKFAGTLKEALIKACNFVKLQPAIQNNILFIFPQSPTVKFPVHQINQATGMIGVPQRYTYRRIDSYRALNAPTTGYKVMVALSPLIIPGDTVSLSSTHLGIQEQQHRVETIRHVGDTFGTEWYSQMEVVLI